MVIDTSVLIEHLRAKDKTKTHLYRLPDTIQLYISAVSLYELYMGATNDEMKEDIRFFTRNYIKISFDDDIALHASKIYHQLRLNNKMIEFRDIFIAATCIANELPIATLNKKHFERIEGLQII